MVTSEIDLDELIIDAAAVLLVCEIVSPSNAATDKVLKMHYYAASGIPWYLVIEQGSATFRLFRLDGDVYAEHARAQPGEALVLTEPVAVTLYPQELLPGR